MFIIWSVRQNQKLLEIECGGGHRAWDYRCYGNSATFVYVKTREVKVTNIQMRSNQVIVKVIILPYLLTIILLEP